MEIKSNYIINTDFVDEKLYFNISIFVFKRSLLACTESFHKLLSPAIDAN